MPKVGLVSLGCPKALVDSEQIATQLLDMGYEVELGDDSDVLVVNTCGFIESAKEESREAIADALEQGKKVVVTGCMGEAKGELANAFPQLEFISGPAEVAPVISAVKEYLPMATAPVLRDAGLPGEARARLTSDHFAYLKISEGCNHKCSFCIIPSMRGKLRSRELLNVIQEAEGLVADGAQELALIAQDLSAYGADLRYRQAHFAGQDYKTNLKSLCEILGGIAPWVRLHYVYPYPHVDEIIPLMRDGVVLPYLDVPLQHASPTVLKAMRRPAAAEKALERIHAWRDICPELAIRSTFIVGFPGETDDDVGQLLDFLEAAELDRAGCFTYSAVDGAKANLLEGHIDEAEKLDRQERVYEIQAEISARRLQRHVGQRLRVLVDEWEEGDPKQGDVHLVGRSMFDAPEIDGVVRLTVEGAPPGIGEFVWADIIGSDHYDLYGHVVGEEIRIG